MTRVSTLLAWVGSVALAFMFGWYIGIKNAARLAAGATEATTYLIFFVVVLLISAAIWATLRLRRHDDQMIHH